MTDTEPSGFALFDDLMASSTDDFAFYWGDAGLQASTDEIPGR